MGERRCAVGDDQGRWAGLPYRLVVRLPLSPGDAQFPGPWARSLACECLVSGLGLGVKLRFGFGAVQREALVRWPGNSTLLALRGPGGKALWTGTVADVVVLAARAALQALGEPWSTLPQPGWEKVLGRGVRRVWAEIADTTEAGHEPPDKRLLYGLATQNLGYATVTRAELRRREHYRIWGPRARAEGEAQFFAPQGAALYLRYEPGATNPIWRGANCHRRDIVYGLAQHNLLVDQLRSLVREVDDGTSVETVGVTGNKRVGEMARLRLALLNDLLAQFPWARHYTRRQVTPEDLGKLPARVTSSLGSAPLNALSARLAEPTEPPEPELEPEPDPGEQW